MALFKILKGNENNLPTTKTPGYMYITEDQGNIFVDLSTTERIQLNAKNAATANAWKTPRKLTLAGDVTGNTTFDGSGDIGLTVTVKDDSHNHVISNIDNLQTILDGKASKDLVTTTTDGLMTSSDKIKLNYTNIAYGTCSTAAATAAKVVTLSGNTEWALQPGATVTIKFSYTNTASNPTLNVAGTGAKPVLYGTSALTTSSLSYAGYKNRYITYVYNGTQYVFQGWSYDANSTYSNASLGQGYATCSTAAATVAKAASLSSYSLTTGGIVAVKFTYDVPASATLNVNSKGAKAIYHKGAAIKAGVIKAGNIATFMYNGSQYHLLSIDRWQDDTATSIKNLSVSGKTITFTKNDGTTGTITTQDTDTKSFTITANASDDDVVVLTGQNGTNAVTYSASHVLKGPSTTASTTKGATANVTVDAAGESGSIKIPKVTVDKYGHTTGLTEQTLSISIPSSIKNPKALTIGSKTYDGSSAQSITAADLGLASAMKFLGTTTTAITDGASTNPIAIGGTNVTAVAGNVVLYGAKEFVFNSNSKWEELGNEGSYKVVQTAVTSPTASGTTVSFIDTISQNAQGVITATKKTVSNATTSAAGLMTAAMVTKLNGISAGANAYVLPTASSSTLGGVKTISTITSTSGLTPCPIISGVPYYKDTNTTYTLSSFGVTSTAAELNKLDGATVTTAEINALSGISTGSTIQAQLNGKQNTIALANGSRVLVSNSGKAVTESSITTTELGYLDGVTSNIQNQISAKLPLAGGKMTGHIYMTGVAGTSTGNTTQLIFGNETTQHISLSTNDKALIVNPTSSSTTNQIVFYLNKVSTMPYGITGPAGSLGTARTIDGVNFDGRANVTHYGTCSTAAATAAKTVACTNYKLATGSIIKVKFTVTNTANNPTLNVNSTGAKPIYYRGAAISKGYLAAKRIYEFVYDGTNYELVGDVDTNTTYSAATTSKNGLMSAADKTKLNALDLNKLNGIESGANKYVHPTHTAKSRGLYKITVDTLGHVSAATAVAKADITALGIPAQDTTYSNMTGATSSAAGKAGLVPAPAAGKQTSFLRGDGTWVVPTNTDTKVTQTTSKNNAKHPLMLTSSATPTSGSAGTSIYNASVYANPNTATIGAKVFEQNNIALTRIYTAMMPYGTVIGENADLNTIDYIKVGNYTCPQNAKVATLTNCPTVTTKADGTKSGVAFMMQVYSPLATTIDNETTGTWVYRLRKLISYTGTEYIQYIYSNGTAGNFSYGNWMTILNSSNGLSALGITANATELNYVDGVTSNIQTQLNAKQATITGAASTIASSNLTASRALVSNSSGKVAVSAVTSTELGYLDGVTSNIQTQLNAKQATITGGATTVVTSNLTASRALVSNSSGKIAVSAVTSTELGYLDGVTSAIQTQLNGKQATITGGASTITSSNLTASRVLVSNANGKVAVSAVTSTELGYLDGVTSNVQTQLNNKRSNTAPSSGSWFQGTPSVGGDGVMELGKYLDFHVTTGSTNDYDTRLVAVSADKVSINLPSASGTLALTSSNITGNAATATALTSSAGSTTQPVYFSGGKPVAISYTIAKSVPSDAKFTDTTYGAATTSAAGLMSANDKTKLDNTNLAYGTCSTAAGTAAKVVTISGNTKWALTAGAHVTVKFSNTNSAKNPTLNVNSTGAKSISYNGTVITDSSLSYAGYKGRYITYVYDGTNYVFLNWSYDTNTTYSNASLGQGYGTCSTAEATTAKVVSCSSYTLTKGGIIAVKFTYAVPASSTMNVNSKGAKNIFYRGAAIKAGIIKAGDTATFMYDGTQYQLLAVDTPNKVANALSINGKTYDGSTAITVGTLGIAYGGTGLTASPSMLVNLASTSAANVLQASPRPGITGTLGASNGGTGCTTLKAAGSAILNALDTGSSTPADNDYYISQYVNGGTTTTSYHRRPMSALWAYIKSKTDSLYGAKGDYVLKTGDTMSGNLTINTSGNPYVKYTDAGYSTAWYTQAYRDKFAMGAGFANSLQIDKTGNVSMPGKLTLGSMSADTTSTKRYVVSHANGTELKYHSSVYINHSTGVLMGAAWNDYAEYRETKTEIEPGRVVIETGNGDLVLSQERMAPAPNVVSDTFGFAIGQTEKCNTPITVSGRVLVYPFEDRELFKAGDAVCAGPNGTVSIMTREEIREYPDRILGIVSEIPEYDSWGETNIKVNNRIWIKIK